MRVDFTINGVAMTMTSEQVEQAVAGAVPEAIRQHGVDVNGTRYPMKQAFALATGLDRLDFTTNQARTQLKRLGFPVVRSGDAT